jgi:hypothetical protein
MEKENEMLEGLKEYVQGLSSTADKELLRTTYNKIVESLMIIIAKIDSGK